MRDENIWIGTSSWKYDGWLGQIYTRDRYLSRGKFSQKRFEAECLGEYAETFPIVCGDFSFYQFPSPEFWQKLFASAPPSLKFALKVPEEVTCEVFPKHPRYGPRAGVKNPAYLAADALRALFLEPLEPYAARIAPLIFEFGSRTASPFEFVDRLDPFLEELHEVSHEIIHLGVLIDSEVLYLDKVFGHNPVRSPSHVGARVPAHCTAIGKAMIAFGETEQIERFLNSRLERRTPYTVVQGRVLREEFETIRQAGVAFDREGARLGLSCVAAPILNRRGRAVAGLSISGATTRFHPERFVTNLRRAASSIGDRLVWAA